MIVMRDTSSAIFWLKHYKHNKTLYSCCVVQYRHHFFTLFLVTLRIPVKHSYVFWFSIVSQFPTFWYDLMSSKYDKNIVTMWILLGVKQLVFWFGHIDLWLEIHDSWARLHKLQFCDWRYMIHEPRLHKLRICILNVLHRAQNAHTVHIIVDYSQVFNQLCTGKLMQGDDLIIWVT